MAMTRCAICDQCGKHEDVGNQTFDQTPVGWWTIFQVGASGAWWPIFCSSACATRWESIQKMREGANA